MNCLNIKSKHPPEFARAERFDGVFFVDIPGRESNDAIRGIYTLAYGLDAMSQTTTLMIVRVLEHRMVVRTPVNSRYL